MPNQDLYFENCVNGKEIVYDNKVSECIKSIFKDCDGEVLYKIAFSDNLFDNGQVICKNKNSEVIATIAIYGKEDNVGFLIILPQFK